MSKCIQALESGQNALLEAPTGSGKTLSLLCSTLAWQARERHRIENSGQPLCPRPNGSSSPKSAVKKEEIDEETAQAGPRKAEKIGCKVEGEPSSDAPAHHPDPSASPPPPSKEACDATQSSPPLPSSQSLLGGFLPGAGDAGPAPSARVPKVYYSTRTHSQIAQVVAELGRTLYRPRTAILASKRHYCVHPRASQAVSVEEACEDLLRDGACVYFRGTQAAGQPSSQRVLDIEDLRQWARAHRACPYFLARRWEKEADLVFAPYSYLIDPVVRRAMEVEPRGAVLVFDEAHNMEDVAREAASAQLSRTQLDDCLASLSRASGASDKPGLYEPLIQALQALGRWMERLEAGAGAAERPTSWRPGGGGNSSASPEVVFQGRALAAELEGLGLCARRTDALWDAYQAVRAEDEAIQSKALKGAQDGGAGRAETSGADPAAFRICVGAAALGLVSRWVQILRLLHRESQDGPRDYRLAFAPGEEPRGVEPDPEEQEDDEESEGALASQPGGKRSRRRGSQAASRKRQGAASPASAALWCLNPAVAFGSLARQAHATVLTSGTLAPLEGFASELGAAFGVRLEAPHVVDMRRQVWTGVLGASPEGRALNGTFRFAQQEAYLDAVGAAVLALARRVPDGLLLFFPSYAALDRSVARWRRTGAWRRLERLKLCVVEPRGGGPDALAHATGRYYRAVDAGAGALLAAVCRGKVSEGVDFADGYARCVVVVGIPYPAAYDRLVVEKRAYNDAGRARGLLPGAAWYQQQAFRALNQALGRCIRHRADYGAIVLLDERFAAAQNQAGLSKWVRAAIEVRPSFEQALVSLAGFFKGLAADPPLRVKPAAPPAEEGGPADQTRRQVDRAERGKITRYLPPSLRPGGAEEEARGGGARVESDGLAMQEEGADREPDIEQADQKFAAEIEQADQKPGAEIEQADQKSAVKLEEAERKPVVKLEQAGPEPGVEREASPPRAAGERLDAASAATGERAAVKHEPSYCQGSQDCPAAKAVAGVLSSAPIATWALLDVRNFCEYLKLQGFTPASLGNEFSTLEEAAAAGVLDCLAAAREWLTAGSTVAALACGWRTGLPLGLRVLAWALGEDEPARGAGRLKGGPAWGLAAEQVAVAARLRGFGAGVLLDGLCAAYGEELRALRSQQEGTPQPKGDARSSAPALGGPTPGEADRQALRQRALEQALEVWSADDEDVIECI